MSKMLQSIYGDEKSCVRSQKYTSEAFDCSIGVRQGCVMNPFLFQCLHKWINLEKEKKCPVGVQLDPDVIHVLRLSLADNLILFDDTGFNLPKELNILQNFCETWKMSFSMSKTKIVVFTNGSGLSRFEKCFFEGSVVVPCYTYRGWYINNRLIWSKTSDKACRPRSYG